MSFTHGPIRSFLSTFLSACTIKRGLALAVLQTGKTSSLTFNNFPPFVGRGGLKSWKLIYILVSFADITLDLLWFAVIRKLPLVTMVNTSTWVIRCQHINAGQRDTFSYYCSGSSSSVQLRGLDMDGSSFWEWTCCAQTLRSSFVILRSMRDIM